MGSPTDYSMSRQVLGAIKLQARRMGTSSARPVNWGFLGCGRIASDFINCLKGLDGAQVSSCAARSSTSAAQFASTHGVPSYGSYEELLNDDEVEVVYVSTIHHLHKEHALMSLRAGKHVLVEKPIALNYADTLELVTEARER